jgi:uncharacterized protein (TIRG00374 family)
VFVQPYISKASKELGDLRGGWTFAAVGFAFACMAATARLQRRLLRAGGVVVSVPRMLGLTYTSNAIMQTIPGGTLVSLGYSFRRIRRWRVGPAPALFAVVVSLALSLLAFGVLGCLGLAVLGDDAVSPAVIVTGLLALGGAVVVVLALRHPVVLTQAARWLTDRSMRLLRKNPEVAVSQVCGAVDALAQIHPRRQDWAAAFVLAMSNWVADLMCLYAAGQAVGAHATLRVVALAYFAGMGVSSLSVLPGGLGPVELAMVVTLTDSVTVESATATVVIYRLVSLVLVVAVGWVLWSISWARDAAARRRTEHYPEISVVPTGVVGPEPGCLRP